MTATMIERTNFAQQIVASINKLLTLFYGSGGGGGGGAVIACVRTCTYVRAWRYSLAALGALLVWWHLQGGRRGVSATHVERRK